MSGHHHYHYQCFSWKRTSEFAQWCFRERTLSLSRRPQSLKRDTSSTIDISQKVVRRRLTSRTCCRFLYIPRHRYTKVLKYIFFVEYRSENGKKKL